MESQDSSPNMGTSWNKMLIYGCGGCAVVVILAMVFGGWALMKLGLGVFSDEVESELRSNPVIIEHVGRIEEFELDLSASVAEEGSEDFIFRVSGTKGSGLVTATCVTNADGMEEVAAGTIQLESGESLDLFPEEENTIEEFE